MRKRILAIFLAAVALACLLWGCKETTNGGTGASDETTPSSGEATVKLKEITVGIAQDLDDSLDPYLTTAAGTREVMFNVFEGLVKPDSTGNYVCAVASDYDVTESGRCYAFTLRDGVVFHNGAVCTPQDVLYSFQTCADTTVDTAVAAALSAVEEISAKGNVVTIRLQEANNDFLSTVANVSIVPEHYQKQATSPVGTGPFQFVSRSVQENVILEKHEAYYGTPASLDRVTYKIYEDGNALFTALNSGALDLVAHLTSDQVGNLSNGYTVLEGTMNLVQALYLNHQVQPFDNVLVRQAMCYAVDVDAMLDLTSDGHGTKVGSSMYPSFGKYFDASLADAYPHDPEKAKELLAAEGYDESNPLTFEIIGYSNNDVVMQAYQADLKSIGVNVELVTQEFGVFLENMVGMNFQMLTGGWGDTTGNPLTSAECYYSGSFGSQNISFYDNPVCDELYITAKTSNDTAEIKDACQQIQQIAWEDVPMFPTFGRNEGYVYNKNLNGVVISPSGTLSFRTATLG